MRLAQWLHDFLSTHSKSENLTVDYIREMCGFEGVTKRFPAQLRIALDELIKSAPELVVSYSIDDQGRSSDRWGVTINRGSEMPKFEMPKPYLLNAALNGKPPGCEKPARERGLKL